MGEGFSRRQAIELRSATHGLVSHMCIQWGVKRIPVYFCFAHCTCVFLLLSVYVSFLLRVLCSGSPSGLCRLGGYATCSVAHGRGSQTADGPFGHCGGQTAVWPFGHLEANQALGPFGQQVATH